MAYVTVTGGQEAIEAAKKLADTYRLDPQQPPLDPSLIQKQMRLLVDRIMSEGGLYAPELASLALKQSEGDTFEAAFLLRAYRSTLPRNHYSHVLDMENMRVIRRISSSFKDIPGGQVLGPTYDFTHRLLRFDLMDEHLSRDDLSALEESLPDGVEWRDKNLTFTKVAGILRDQGLLGRNPALSDTEPPFDITREKYTSPAPRSARLQALARGETGAMMALAYSSMRGYGAVHPTIGELRVGYAPVCIPHPYQEGESVYVGETLVTEVETINKFATNEESGEVEFFLGYGCCFGQNELKAISMAILDRSISDGGTAPAEDEEFVLEHIDSIEANGFVSHLKLPHYVTFQSKLDRIRATKEKQNGGE
ncbi:alpha-D-ribose 1-methylphosphonate 5-triphosphate synthase subunit PhnI [Geomicrobium halophilum]|uniref:Alpha-D-ribose 1-methylphosphonate 5-triphosphate synthase subunit PhnI n=1 Tax=Geomicrobium halophilum TaxID=549000 RepID=A0A841PYU6_9BACL|nr:carbon-phosphorus lyase complex subunit PhnI [Geomicrobium halophilum]MBB6449913.1 alpha-D-ribose 1-methylphosphonate 5-triphosphate synthase subunit PhnI [Geomicrobium halophilum]